MIHDHDQFREVWHEYGCPCDRCEPPVPSVPARLTAPQLSGFAFAGIAVGNAIAFAIDPAGSARALLATIWW